MTATRPHSLVDHLAETLRERLLVMRDGDKLPTVRQLMASFGVSQLTVQRALAKLKQEGLIAPQVGRGTFVGPSVVARARPRNVLVLTQEQQTDRSDEVARALHRSFLKRAWRSAVLTYGDFDQALHLVRNGPRVDACVVHPRLATLPVELLAALNARSDAVVVEGYAVEGIDVDRVGIDWPAAVALALRHLLDLGHRRIGFVTVDRPARQFLASAQQFRMLHQWAGLGGDGDPVVLLPPVEEAAMFEALRSKLRVQAAVDGGPAFTALVVYAGAYHGEALLGSLMSEPKSACQEIGLVALGFTDLAQEHVDRITTVGSSSAVITEAVAAQIEERWSRPAAPFRTRFIVPEIVVRSSSRPFGRTVTGRPARPKAGRLGSR